MGDPFGIIGVIGVAAQVIQMTVQVGLDWKDAPSDARAFLLELRTLQTVLQETNKNITQNPDFVKAFEDRHSTILSQLGDPSKETAARSLLSAAEVELKNRVKDLTKRSQSGRVSWETLKGAFTAKKTRDAVENLNRQCQALNSMAAIDAIALGASTHSKVLETQKAVEEVQQHQLNQVKNTEEKLILEWLTPIDYAPQQVDFIKRRQSGTGQWLLDHPDFRDWLQGDKGTLFCPGIPGAGKTILTAVVVEHLTNQFHNDSNVGIAYIYCNFRRTDEQKLEDLLASLLRQLTESQISLPRPVTELHERHKKKRTRPSADELSKALQETCASFSRSFIIVDALDECQAAQRSSLVKEAINLGARRGVNLFMTSRLIPEITDKLDRSCWLEIRASKEDVERYLEDHIQQSSSAIQKMQGEIKTAISDAVDGMFLLAQIYFDSLKSETRPKKIRAILKGLGTQIADSGEKQRLELLIKAYDDAMQRITEEPRSRDLGIQVLSWITCAKRPLTTTELQYALTVEPGDLELNEEDLLEVNDMVAVCAGLVTVDEEGDIIRLVHYTTQEYLQRTQGKWFPNAEKDISTICVTYLSFSQFETGACATNDEFEERLQNNPLYDYAARNWGHHARQASISSKDAICLLQTPSLREASSQALLIAKRSWHWAYSQQFPRYRTSLHVVAYFGMVAAVAELIAAGAIVNAKDGDDSTPLHLASWNGHATVVQLLIEAAAMVNAWNKDEKTPLHLASSSGYYTVAQLLLKGGAKVNSFGDYNRRPLHHASRNGHDAIVQLLIEAGADINAEDRAERTPLHLASWNGHATVVQLLIVAGATSVGCEDKRGITPLHYASQKGHNAVVQLLIAAGANVNDKDHDDSTPLHDAAASGYCTIVQKLIATGATVDASDIFKWTSLHFASRNGHDAIVQLLIKAGATVDAKNKDEKTPLYYASLKGHDTIVQKLIEAGATVDTKDKYESKP